MNTNLTSSYHSELGATATPKADYGRYSRRLLVLATVATAILAFVPYSNYILYPLRLFVTFIHESGHALAALVSGGSVDSLRVMRNGEGVTLVRVSDLTAWLALSGGYLGTAVFGAIMLQIARLTRLHNAGRVALTFGAGFIAVMTLLYARDVFTLVLGVLLSVAFAAMARLLSPRAAQFAIAFLAVQCCLNALGDLSILFHLTAAGSGHNDAGFMANQYGLSPIFWAVLWCAAAFLILVASLRSYWRATKNQG